MDTKQYLAEHLDVIVEVAQSLASANGADEILESIVDHAMRLTNAEGATLYVVRDGKLHFEIVRNTTLGFHFGGVDGAALPDLFEPISLTEDSHGRVVLHVLKTGDTANIDDVYHSDFDFSGTYASDEKYQYRSQSFLTVGMFNRDMEPIGVLQLINATDAMTKKVCAFGFEEQQLVEALAGMGGAILKNALLSDELSNLLEAFIKLIAEAVDQKSPYTGGHCRRVPELVMDFARAVHDAQTGPFKDVQFSDADMYELHVAGWMHDIGKICIPEYVMDKATKLETIHDRIHEVQMRFELCKRDAEIQMLQRRLAGEDVTMLTAEYDSMVATLDDEFAFIQETNIGGEFMHDAKIERIHQIAKRQVSINGVLQPILSEEYVYNLCIQKGTLTVEERDKIRDHMRITIDMLEALPFPKHLQRVPEFAGGHHETMIGTGYPRGLTKDQMSIQARMMAIVDVFEALTASDRPYKEPKKLSESMKIMGFMKKDHHFDPDLLDEFVRSDVYLPFAQKYMAPEHIDTFDKEAFLAIQPKPLS